MRGVSAHLAARSDLPPTLGLAVLARDGDGLVYAFPKLGTTAVNVVPVTLAGRSKALTLMPPEGTGLLVGGSLLTLAGTPCSSPASLFRATHAATL